MKAALISDTHGMLPDPKKFEKVDFILHAGDIGPDWYKGTRGIFPWYKDEFSEWARAIGKPIHMTWGNHDFIGERADHSIWEELLPENVHIHVDEQVEIEGKKVWFSPWSPTFGNWAWMCSENDLTTKYINIPADTQIIVSHSPPHMYGDFTCYDKLHVGSGELLMIMKNLPNLKLVVCGHIHEARGIYKDDKVEIRNVSLVNEIYDMIHEPDIIDWD